MTTLHGQVRSRGELRQGEEKVLLRTRLSVDAKPSKHVRTFLQIQDSRTWGEEASTAAAMAAVDLHQGWAEVSGEMMVPMALRTGRMELSYGDQRLIGAFGWSNIGRAFDAARLRIGPAAGVTADVFWARLGATSQDLSGIYTTWAPASSAFAADVYGLYLRGADDDQRVMTLGTRVKVTPGAGITAKGEVAHQSGKTGDLDVSAYAVHGEVGAAIPMAAKPGVEVGFDMASGDTDPTDDKNETFNNLFPTNHLHYGHLDLASWKNLQDIYAGVSMKPTPGLKVYARVHMLSRKTTEDTAYVASGKPLAALDVASATDESDLGQEVDVVAIWKVTPGLKLLGGWSYMKVGPFLEAVDPDGDDNRNFTYLQLAGGF